MNSVPYSSPGKGFWRCRGRLVILLHARHPFYLLLLDPGARTGVAKGDHTNIQHGILVLILEILLVAELGSRA